jgi:hypothetical protein
MIPDANVVKYAIDNGIAYIVSLAFVYFFMKMYKDSAIAHQKSLENLCLEYARHDARAEQILSCVQHIDTTICTALNIPQEKEKKPG